MGARCWANGRSTGEGRMRADRALPDSCPRGRGGRLRGTLPARRRMTDVRSTAFPRPFDSLSREAALRVAPDGTARWADERAERLLGLRPPAPSCCARCCRAPRTRRAGCSTLPRRPRRTTGSCSCAVPTALPGRRAPSHPLGLRLRRPAQHLERVLDSCRQVEHRKTRTAGGSGLGLTVSRRIARLLGGDVSAASAPSAGSRFVVSIPRTRSRSGSDRHLSDGPASVAPWNGRAPGSRSSAATPCRRPTRPR